MQQKQIQHKQMQQRQMQQKQFTRRHDIGQGVHEHSMSLSTSGSDKREMFIPSGTITEEAPRKIRYAYFRSWIMSLLALFCLPLGAMLILVGTAMSNSLTNDWVQTTATVQQKTDTSISYIWRADGEEENGEISWEWQAYVHPNASGEIAAKVSLCDVASLVMLPREPGAEFPVWYDPQSPSHHQCVPVTQDWAATYVVVGWILVAFAVWMLIRIFHRAGLQLAKS